MVSCLQIKPCLFCSTTLAHHVLTVQQLLYQYLALVIFQSFYGFKCFTLCGPFISAPLSALWHHPLHFSNSPGLVIFKILLSSWFLRKYSTILVLSLSISHLGSYSYFPNIQNPQVCSCLSYIFEELPFSHCPELLSFSLLFFWIVWLLFSRSILYSSCFSSFLFLYISF